MLQFRLVGLGLGTGKSKQCHENENKIQKSSKIRIRGYLVWGVGFFFWLFVLYQYRYFNLCFLGARGVRFWEMIDLKPGVLLAFLFFSFAMGTLSQRNERRVHVCSTNQSTGLYQCRILVTLA